MGFFGASSIKLISWSHSCLSGSFSNFFLLNKCVNGWIYFRRSSGFVRSSSLSPPFDSFSSFGSSLLDHGVNRIDSCSVLQYSGHLVNCITSSFQSTSGLYSTSQSCPRNKFVFLISNTTVSIYLMCLFELISRSTNSLIVFSPFLDPSELYTLNGLGSDLVNISFSSTVFLVMVVFVHPELINVLTLSFLLSLVLIVGCTISSLNCFLYCRIIYWFLVELFTVVYCIVPIPNLQQNSSVFHYLNPLIVNFWSLFVEMLCTLWWYDLFCHIWNILVASSLSLVVCNFLPCVQICYSCNTWVCVLIRYSIVILFPLVCPFLHRLFLNLFCNCSRCWSIHILVWLLWLLPSIVLDFLGSKLVDMPLWLW